jgi:hypothetical protein
MKWIGISGSRLLTSKVVEHDVRREVRAILERGGGIVTGGALGMDSFAMDEVCKLHLADSRLKVCLPTTLEIFKVHYLKRAEEGIITENEAKTLIKLLSDSKDANPEAIIEDTRFFICDRESYYARNETIMNFSSEVYAFQVNGSEGTQNTIDIARS